MRMDRNTQILNAKMNGHEEGRAEGKMEERESAYQKSFEIELQKIEQTPNLPTNTSTTLKNLILLPIHIIYDM